MQNKQKAVNDIFTAVVDKYDLMNDLMSFGLHRCWKKRLLTEVTHNSNDKILDVAGGTGDITFQLLDRYPTADITVCDINQQMIEKGRNRALNKNHLSVQWVCGNAQQLPFPDNSFTYYVISFGIRNTASITQTLREAYRVLKNNGKFICLEFSHLCTHSALNKLYDMYSYRVIPLLGKYIAKQEHAYQYLVQSIRDFPNQEDFAHMIREAGFTKVSYVNIDKGIVALHTGQKLIASS